MNKVDVFVSLNKSLIEMVILLILMVNGEFYFKRKSVWYRVFMIKDIRANICKKKLNEKIYACMHKRIIDYVNEVVKKHQNWGANIEETDRERSCALVWVHEVKKIWKSIFDNIKQALLKERMWTREVEMREKVW